VEIVEEAVRLKPSALGVKVSVRYIDNKDALLIAEQVALGLDTPQLEAAMAARGLQAAPFTGHETSAAADIGQLAWLLREEAVKAGYTSCYQVASLAADGDAKASEIMRREDFSRRFQMMKDLSSKIGYYDPPGEPFTGQNLFVKVGERPGEPVSPVPSLWINGGRAVALLSAGLLFLALNRWKPSLLRPHPAKPPRPPKRRVPAPPPVNKDPW
jgi:hypothetical protein